MRTLTLGEAADMLKMHPEGLRRRAKSGLVPAAKPGKQWVFLQEDLQNYLRSLYASNRQALQGDHGSQKTWRFSDAVVPGGLISPARAARELESLLAPKTSRKPKSSTTSSKRKRGGSDGSASGQPTPGIKRRGSG
ncbi:DNA binding protein, excisionase family [Paraburkholderia dioscoreae]|uniref:DNA binding protein, excisionase family n=1 Tax=Paraburkholderia dioscoreae TaxID=2604047 RepID=A0A5Q4YU33_9BURK|nr:DNA binding protein, excisionase family [Paraburkholderia dioscoreae]